MKIKKILFIIFISTLITCDYPEIVSDIIVYENDFESDQLDEIDGGVISNYQSNKVLGYYNKDGFTIHINNIPNHDYIFISFDLYIHGTWDGNLNGFNDNDKPDKWIMELRPDMDLYQNDEFDRFETTFSNSPCYANWCRRQSYPNEYPAENNPQSGTHKIGLERTCDGYWGGPTSLYKIEKSFSHKGNVLVVKFFDELYQPNAIDSQGMNAELCDESWSLDNLRIRAISYK